MPVIDIIIPEEIGPVEECVIVTWLKRVGDPIKQGEDLVIIQAEKTSYDVPAPASGILKAILVPQGEVAKQAQPLAQLEASETAASPAPTAPSPAPAQAAPADPPVEVRASPIAKRLARQHGLDLAQIKGSGQGGRITEKDVQSVIEAQAAEPSPAPAPAEAVAPAPDIRASPVARRIAKEHHIDLADIPGAGERRITEKDVQTYLETQAKPAAAASPGSSSSLPLAGMRATIARRMHQSLQEMAQLTLHTEVDVTELVALRARLKERLAVTYTDLLVKATALALRQHPRLNATLEGEQIKLLPDIHIGLAVALAEGLIVPVLREADRQSLAALARERSRLVEQAQANQLGAAEMSGSTFTITNLGTYDIDAFTPIVNPPEAAILGVGRIVDKVVIHQGKVAQRAMLTLSLSFDHRLNDGAPAAAFLQTIKRYLEQPSALE